MRISQAIGMWMVGILKFPPVKSLRKISTARFETTEMICVAPWWKKGLCILYSSPFLASRKAAAWPIPCGHFWFIKVIGGDINWNDHFYWGQCFYDQKKGISIHVQSVSLKQKKHRDAQRKFQSHLNDYDSKVDVIWLVVYLPFWKMMEFVSWTDETPNIWKNNPNVPNHQLVIVVSPTFSSRARLYPSPWAGWPSGAASGGTWPTSLILQNHGFQWWACRIVDNLRLPQPILWEYSSLPLTTEVWGPGFSMVRWDHPMYDTSCDPSW